MRVLVLSSLVGGFAWLAGCANDPVYLASPMKLEAGVRDMTGMLTQAKAQLQLPIKTETASDMQKRMALQTKLGIDVPYVKVGDLEIEVEWTITNLEPSDPKRPMDDRIAMVELNGANEFYSYDPSIIVLDPGNDEAPPTPGLDGDIPIHVPNGGQVSGLFTEDQLREASIDLDQITRGNVNPFRAMFTVSKNATSFQPMSPLMPGAENYMQTPMGTPIPREAFAEIVRVDVVFKPEGHMTLDFNVRVRDVRGILHGLLLTAATQKPGELQTFMPMEFNPPPAMTTP